MLRALAQHALVRSTGIYTASRIVNAAVPFLILPILTRYLSPADYGIVAMFFVLLGLASPFVGLSLHGAVGVRYFDKAETDLPRYVGTCFGILAATTLIVAIAVWAFAGPISRATEFPREWLWAVVAVAAGQFTVMVVMTLWQVEEKPIRYGVFQNAQTAVNVGLTVLLVVGLGRKWEGRIEAHAAAVLVFGAISWALLLRGRMIRLGYDRQRLGHALRFGVPLIPHVLGSMLIVQTDRLFITRMVGISDAGIYTVGFQVASIVELLASSFNQAYSPWLYKRLAEGDPAVKRRIVGFTYLYFAGMLVFAVLFAAVSTGILGYLVGERFVGAGQYIFWLALGFSFSGMYYMVANFVFFSGRTFALSVVTFLAAAINIALNYVLIRRNGPVGAAQASATALLFSFLATWFISARLYRMPWNLKAAPTHAA